MTDAYDPVLPHADAADPRRRAFLTATLFGASAAVLATATPGWTSSLHAAPAAGALAPEGFLALSRLLTAHPELNPDLADAAWSALVEREPDFAARFTDLQRAVDAAGLHDMRDFGASPVAADAALKRTAVAIVGAWYLGRVGEVKPRSEDGPAFITYTGALMWRPTLDVTVIPTYSRGRPGFWAEKPATLATD
ncbi:sugar dehydrogenase complex small subunit [Frateuria defendens]|uniref:sugar dehydrogenase complex small subunit n=1 Tax=Frateuria defendens TaxID=2219559 RepID=UPI00069DDC0E|nr:sugar dehydrogenase complex small subunit [Frateuria defendens]